FERPYRPYPEVAGDRAPAGRPLVDAPAKIRDDASQCVFLHVAMRADDRDILLLLHEEDGGKADGISHHYHKHPGDPGVERPCVTDPLPEDLTRPCRHLVA